MALVTDMSTGLMDRFRSLPMSRWAVLTARSIAELLTQMISAVVVVCVGLAIGWRVHTGPAEVIAAFALALLFGYAFTWAGICLGMALRSPEAAQQSGFIIFLPLTFISSAFVPTQGMPGWLQPIAEWNPMSALAAACRAAVRQPEPGRLGARLADAASRARRGLLVGRRCWWCSRRWRCTCTAARRSAEPAAVGQSLDRRRRHALYIGRMTEQSPEFAGLAALVTGGASGIGLATARLLAARGARVAVLDRVKAARTLTGRRARPSTRSSPT